jgi:hypothetical protein
MVGVDPVGDLPIALLQPAGDVAHHLSVELDRPFHDGFVIEEPLPVSIERTTIGRVGWDEPGHTLGLSILLVGEEQGEIVGGDRAQSEAFSDHA